MRRIESIEDQMNGVVTFELSDGRRYRCSAHLVAEMGAAKLLRAAGLGHLLPKDRVAVIQCGRRMGTMPGDFDPMSIQSRSFLYDPRPGDFRREGDTWVASPMLGPGDFMCIPGFEPEPSS